LLDLLNQEQRPKSAELTKAWIASASSIAESNYNVLLNDRLAALILLTELIVQSGFQD
jgi:hypothetical protein